MDTEDFRKAGYQAIDRICEYYSRLENIPLVSKVEPGYLRRALPDSAPEQSEHFDEIADDFQTLILPGITHWQHPSFFGYFPTPATPESLLGELYAGSISNPGFNWICSPACTELEAVVMDWSAKLFGLSEAFLNLSGVGGGVIQTTASEATLTAAVAARSAYTRRYPVNTLSDFVIYVTTHTHSSGVKTSLILGITHRALEVHEEDAYGLRGSTLMAAIEEDRARGKHPFIIVATIGTTGCGAIDKIDEIGKVCQEEGLWLHVDAAWAGATLACPEYREVCNLDAINTYASSFCVNFHKWGLVNFDASAFWVRDRKFLTDALDITPEFLRSKPSEDGTVIDYRNWQLPLGRRFRSLKVWFVLRSFGAEGFRAYLRKCIALSGRFSELVKSSSVFELVTPPSFALTVFRLIFADGCADNNKLNALNRKFHHRLASTDLFLTQTDVNGTFCFRLAVGSTRTEERHILAVWDILCAEARAILADYTS